MKIETLEAKGRLKIQRAPAASDGDDIADVFELANRFVFQRFGIALGLLAWSRWSSSSFCSSSRYHR